MMLQLWLIPTLWTLLLTVRLVQDRTCWIDRPLQTGPISILILRWDVFMALDRTPLGIGIMHADIHALSVYWTRV